MSDALKYPRSAAIRLNAVAEITAAVFFCVFVSLRDNFLWLHSIFALVYFIITLLCMAHHSVRLEYSEDERVCPNTLHTFKICPCYKYKGLVQMLVI